MKAAITESPGIDPAGKGFSDEPTDSRQMPKPGSGRTMKDHDNEEPELALEPDLPSDGRDEEGEAMIRQLPRSPELSEPAGKTASSTTTTT